MKIWESELECRIDLEGEPISGVGVLNARRMGVDREALVLHPGFGFSPLPKAGLRVHIAGLGDVGATLLTGLCLLGGGVVGSIGIYDPNQALCRRYELEMNQILPVSDALPPRVEILRESHLFACDAFVFAASKSVPAPGPVSGDVRLLQRDANKALVAPYARAARGFAGLFAVVSDPVDILCRHVFLTANDPGEGPDGPGLKSSQIRGFGLGVMAARAAYYARQDGLCPEYPASGRVYGPHGAALVAANAFGASYDHPRSLELTKRTVEANLRLRELGYKPYLAPGLSSAAISLMHFFSRQWCLSSIPLGDVYFGCKTLLDERGLLIEAQPMDEPLYGRILSARDWLRRNQ